jgi:hypothetical protein
LVLGVGEKKPQVYDGENKYKPLFDFLNVHSETFFRVGEDKNKQETGKQDKPWLSEVNILIISRNFQNLPQNQVMSFALRSMVSSASF